MTRRPPLDDLAALAGEAAVPTVSTEARELADRLGEGRFYVACVGQFKRGKSTLINALLGTSILPTGVVPVTAVPTVLRHGRLAARVRFAGGWREVDPGDLADYVSEERNPGNRLGVMGVEVGMPSPLLDGGLCLVDTPGLGSAIEPNTAATREFLPHIDAAVAVLGADPPISGEELAFLAQAAERVETLIVVLNKADRIPATERREAAAFTTRMLAERLGRAPARIFEVSALAGRRDELTEREWRELVSTLERLPASAGPTILGAAARRGFERLAGRLAWELGERRRALVDPLEVSERRVHALGDLRAAAERALADLAPLLAAEEQRMARWIGAAREAFLAQATPGADERLRERLAAGGPDTTREAALTAAGDVARAVLEPWLAEMERRSEERYAEVTRRFRELAGTLPARLVESVPDAAPLPLREDAADTLTAPRRFYFTALMHYHYPASPWWHLWRRVMPAGMRRRRDRKAAEAYLLHLLEVNSARVEGDLNDRVTESRRRLEAAVRAAVEDVGRAADDALARARLAREAGQLAVAADVERIDRLLERLQTILPPAGQAA